MDRLEIAQALGMFGGTLAALNWLPTVILLARFRYLLVVSGLWLVLLPALTGFCVSGLSFRGAILAPRMPQRAKQQFYAAGWLGILVGILCFPNVFLIVSSIFILVAGNEAGNVVQRIARARRQTGFPFGTVATAAGSPWHRRLSCAYCGAPLVVTLVAPARPDVRIEASCPLDGIRDRQRLPLSQLEEWAPVLADRLHRCAKCGERTTALLVLHQGVLFTTLRSICANQHRTYPRRVWTPLHSHVAREPAVDVRYQATGVAPPFSRSIQPYGSQTFEPIQPFGTPSVAASRTPSTQPRVVPWQPVVPARAAYPTRFCRICGTRIEPGDRFCCQCGGAIR